MLTGAYILGRPVCISMAVKKTSHSIETSQLYTYIIEFDSILHGDIHSYIDSVIRWHGHCSAVLRLGLSYHESHCLTSSAMSWANRGTTLEPFLKFNGSIAFSAAKMTCAALSSNCRASSAKGISAPRTFRESLRAFHTQMMGSVSWASLI